MNEQRHHTALHHLQQGQAMIQVIFTSTIVLVFAITFAALAGTSMRQLFGDIQCKMKYGHEAYMDTFYEQAYCFRLTYSWDGTPQRDGSHPIGKPFISESAPRKVIVMEELANCDPLTPVADMPEACADLASILNPASER